MTVRAKLKCISIEGEHVKFQCLYDSANSPEDNSFSKYTPWGSAEFGVSNPDAMGQFQVGEYYYFDIVAVPSTETNDNENTNEGEGGESETGEGDGEGGGSGSNNPTKKPPF